MVQVGALGEPTVEGQQRLEVAKAPVPRTRRWQRACAFACGDGVGGASRPRSQSRQELVCYNKTVKTWHPAAWLMLTLAFRPLATQG